MFIQFAKKHDIVIWASMYGFRNPDTKAVWIGLRQSSSSRARTSSSYTTTICLIAILGPMRLRLTPALWLAYSLAATTA
jgi:hypothetical protein